MHHGRKTILRNKEWTKPQINHGNAGMVGGMVADQQEDGGGKLNQVGLFFEPQMYIFPNRQVLFSNQIGLFSSQVPGSSFLRASIGLYLNQIGLFFEPVSVGLFFRKMPQEKLFLFPDWSE
jgi:hypothetical protein